MSDMRVRVELDDGNGQTVGGSLPIVPMRPQFRAAIQKLANDIELTIFGPERKSTAPPLPAYTPPEVTS